MMKINQSKVGKCIAFLMMAQASVLLINGSFWDDSLFSYLLPLFLFGMYVEEKDHRLDREAIRWPLVVDGLITVVFAFGLYAGGETASAKSLIKVLIVLVGGFFICRRLFFHWRRTKSTIIGNKIRWIIGLAVFCVFTVVILGQLEIVSFRFGAGFLISYFTYSYISQSSRVFGEGSKTPLWVSGILSLLTSAGYLEKVVDRSDDLGVAWLLFYVFVLLLWWVIWLVSLALIFDIMGKTEDFWKKGKKAGINKWMFPVTMFIILICYIPYFMSYYPGILSGDSIAQMEQVLGVTGYSNHHPIAHTMLIQLLFQLGRFFGGFTEIGIAAYTFFSMLFLAGVFAYTLKWLVRIGVPLHYRVATFAFYALFPINAAYSITMWKDIIFSGFVLLYMILLYELGQESISEKGMNLKMKLALVILGAGICIFRGNGLYVWALTQPFVIFMMRRRWKIATGISGIVVVLFLFYRSILGYYQVPPSDFIESLSIPAQQIAYTVKQKGNISEEEYEMLDEVIDVGKIPEVYKEYISDPVKNLVREKGNQAYLEDQKGEYFKLYLQIGLKNPYCYIQSFVHQTKGYWFHKVSNWVYYPSGVAQNTLGINRDTRLPVRLGTLTDQILAKSESLYNKYFSLGLQTYVLLICFGYCLYRKRKNAYVSLIPLLGVVATLLIATPVSAEFRYVYALFIALPVMPAVALINRTEEGRQNKLSGTVE